MERDELIMLLELLAENDLVEGENIYDHPCSVAVREIKKLESKVGEAIGWAYAYACVSVDDNIDIRTIEVPEILEQAKIDLDL